MKFSNSLRSILRTSCSRGRSFHFQGQQMSKFILIKIADFLFRNAAGRCIHTLTQASDAAGGRPISQLSQRFRYSRVIHSSWVLVYASQHHASPDSVGYMTTCMRHHTGTRNVLYHRHYHYYYYQHHHHHHHRCRILNETSYKYIRYLWSFRRRREL